MDYGPSLAWQVELGKLCSLLRQLILLLIFSPNKTYHFPLLDKSARRITSGGLLLNLLSINFPKRSQ